MEKFVLNFDNYYLIQELLGPTDNFSRLVEGAMNVTINHRGNSLVIEGEDAELVYDMFVELQKVLLSGYSLDERTIMAATKLAKNKKLNQLHSLFSVEIAKTVNGAPIVAKTIGQKEYIEGIKKCDLTFGIGAAGTGKTYLAVIMATNALKANKVDRIVLTRPAVEAGESLGFLPGDLKEKVDPYLRPLYDALYDVLGIEKTTALIESGTIEIAPLAYMRGRTLENAFIILDEAQNTTNEQMKMFLTRLGFGSKMVVTGDKTQIDLPRKNKSGLVTAERILLGVKDVHIQTFDKEDVVRHPLVAKVINAYATSDSEAG